MHDDRRSLQEIHHWLRQLLPARGHRRLLSFLPLAMVGAVFGTNCHLNVMANAGRRMRIEEMFSDLKSRGFDLEKTRLTDPQRVVRLARLPALAYLWLLLVATVAIRRGHRHLVDVARRRALSYFQIARRLLRCHPQDIVGHLIRAAGHVQAAK